MPTTAELFALARLCVQTGDLAQAEAHCRQVLHVDPCHADALHLLGGLAYQFGHFDAAAQLVRRALEQVPTNAAWHADLGLILVAHGRMLDAAECYDQALRLRPEFAEAHAAMGHVLTQIGRLEDAVRHGREAVRQRPDLPAGHNNLGNALQRLGRTGEAAACYERALQLQPNLAEAHNNIGLVRQEQGRPEDAAASYRRAIQLRPNYADAHYNLGNVLKIQGYVDAAVASYREALRHRPGYGEALNNLGSLLKDHGRLADAIDSFRQALHHKPDSAEIYSNLGAALVEQGEVDAAMDCYRQALQCRPDFADVHSNLLLTLHYRPGVTIRELSEAHAQYERRHAAPLRATWKPHQNTREPDRRLRIGFVSPDLRRHAISNFVISFLENLDRGEAEAICYYDWPTPDNVTARFRAASADWRDVFGSADDRLAEQIRGDRIDILFDLAGHTAHNRLLVFARKPAPIQVTWCGYSDTTGLAAIDYILADRYLIPPEAESYYSERPLRMPEGFLCYTLPADAPPVSPLPALRRGHVTFGSFNNPAKIGPPVVAVWAEILRRLPDARLLLQYRVMDDPTVSGRMAKLFSRHGIEPVRVELRGRAPDLLAQYQDVDIALDPFPYTGCTTTAESLWMGAPVITLPGEAFIGRHSLSHLTNVGLTETIADSSADYVERAVRLAADLPRLAELRAGLRERVASSSLGDGRRFAENLLGLLRDAWRNWVSSGPA
jgi:predicted O-linked N-acetylglucosamine transferase (SPINDLY family)